MFTPKNCDPPVFLKDSTPRAETRCVGTYSNGGLYKLDPAPIRPLHRKLCPPEEVKSERMFTPKNCDPPRFFEGLNPQG